MFVKDEAQIIEQYQKRIDDGEDVVFEPDKRSMLLIAAFTLILGAFPAFSCLTSHSFSGIGYLLATVGLWSVSGLNFFEQFNHDGLLILNAKGLQFYEFSSIKFYRWQDLNKSHTTQDKLYSYLTLELNSGESVRIGQYEHKAIARQTLEKLIEANIKKIKI
jgi:hypothetical protein